MDGGTEPAHEPGSPETPEALLDRLRDHPDWDERRREDELGRIVGRFPPGRLIAAVLPRLRDLGGPDADALFRLIEAHPEPRALDALAEALEGQLDLPPERIWEGLAVLDAHDRLERHPALLERWNDLAELLDEVDPVRELVEQIEGDPDGVALALQGLEAIEPEVRAEIIEGLAGLPLGPGLVEFLRLLAYSPDPETRAAALAVLEAGGPDEDESDDEMESVSPADAWRDLAAHHPDEEVRTLARRESGPDPADAAPAVATPRIVRSLVTAVDGRGLASVVLVSRTGDGARTITAAFVCDVLAGLVDVIGRMTDDSRAALADFDELTGSLGREAVVDRHALALGLLAGCLWLEADGAATPPSARFWIEATAGPGLRPSPLPDHPDPSGRPAEALTPAEVAEASYRVLDACPDWGDASPLTAELAEEIRLRQGGGPPDPARDSGAYRFLFERRLKGELERYRRMLFWMARLWSAAGRDELAASASAIARQLSDAQHAVPGHPFTVALTTRSLERAAGRAGG